MIIEKINKHNIKCVLLDSKTEYKPECDDDCFAEIIIKTKFLKKYILSRLAPVYKEKLAEINLTNREKEILMLISKGKNNEQIAKEMKVSIHTTKVQIHNIFNKLSVKDRTEAVVKAIQNNWIDISSDFNSQH